MTAPDLVRIEVPGRWIQPPRGPFPGRALNAWLFERLNRLDRRCATALHNLDAPKPIRIALLPGERSGLVVAGYGYMAEAMVLALSVDDVRELSLDGGRWIATGPSTIVTRGWPDLRPDAEHDVTNATFSFRTPTSFSRHGVYVPLPDPMLVYVGLAARWAAFGGPPLSAATELPALVMLQRFQAESVPVQMKGFIAAFTGEAEFRLSSGAPPAAAPAFTALTRFAHFAGVGMKTGMGMGDVQTYLGSPQRDRICRTSR